MSQSRAGVAVQVDEQVVRMRVVLRKLGSSADPALINDIAAAQFQLATYNEAAHRVEVGVSRLVGVIFLATWISAMLLAPPIVVLWKGLQVSSWKWLIAYVLYLPAFFTLLCAYPQPGKFWGIATAIGYLERGRNLRFICVPAALTFLVGLSTLSSMIDGTLIRFPLWRAEFFSYLICALCFALPILISIACFPAVNLINVRRTQRLWSAVFVDSVCRMLIAITEQKSWSTHDLQELDRLVKRAHSALCTASQTQLDGRESLLLRGQIDHFEHALKNAERVPVSRELITALTAAIRVASDGSFARKKMWWKNIDWTSSWQRSLRSLPDVAVLVGVLRLLAVPAVQSSLGRAACWYLALTASLWCLRILVEIIDSSIPASAEEWPFRTQQFQIA